MARAVCGRAVAFLLRGAALPIWITPGCVHGVADYLLRATQRSTIVEIGCDLGEGLLRSGAQRRIGIDDPGVISLCARRHPRAAEWLELDAARQQCQSLARGDAVVICGLDPAADLRSRFELLSSFQAQGALLLTAAPERIGAGSHGSFREGWSLEEYASLLRGWGLSPTYTGRALSENGSRPAPAIVTLHDPAIHSARSRCGQAPRRPLAILSAYNESDVIAEVVEDWLEQGCDLVLVDNWSNDGTWEIIREFSRRHPNRVEARRFPHAEPSGHFELQRILRNEEEIAAAHPGRWIIHTDADELRRSPFPGTTLAEGLEIASLTGANRVRFNLINFRPVDDRPFHPGTLRTGLNYFEFGTRPGHYLQAKAWFQDAERVDLAGSGGHIARFSGARDFPYRFLLRHYPIRSQEHGVRKIFKDRQPRWSPYERGELGWHTHYDGFSKASDFIWPRSALIRFDAAFWENYGLCIMTDLMQRRLQEQVPAPAGSPRPEPAAQGRQQQPAP